ncbi:MAG: insulinase family protein [Clostridia bacterium]|nr:insulinase family protein [Clostridia bacterium]
MSVNLTPISEGVEGLFIKNDRFNTSLISFNFYLPLNGDTVADNGLLPFILTTCSDKYQDFSKLNYKLSKLYGAHLEASTEKTADFQLLKIAISVINDRFAIDGEQLTAEACELLLSLIFEPKVADGAFCSEDVEREKRKAIEHIRSEISEKRIYAKNRLIEEMYKGKPYGTPKCGSEEQVNACTGESLYSAWKNLLSSAFVRVHVVSSAIPAGLFDTIGEKFSSIVRDNITDCTSVTSTEPAERVNTITEKMSVAQGKLVMGFSSEIYGNNAVSLMVATDVFGGGPYSRLFSNVREKMSLCYYCSATAVRIKGLVTVDSGVEAQNFEKAQSEILNQLEIVKKGEFSDFEFESSIRSLRDSLKTYNDSQSSTDLWYALRISDEKLISPEEFALLLDNVKKDAVIEAAKGIKLHTVYRLMPDSAEV